MITRETLRMLRACSAERFRKGEFTNHKSYCCL